MDYCVASSSLLHQIHDFSIDQSLNFPSDHAPVSIKFPCQNFSNAALLYQDASHLGKQVDWIDQLYSASRRDLKAQDVDTTAHLCAVDSNIDSQLYLHSPREACEVFTDTIYECARISRLARTHIQQREIPMEWEDMLSSDSEDLWRKINLKGECNPLTKQ